MNYKKYDLNNYTVHFIKTKKFKSIYISLVLINEFKKEYLTKNFILRKLLTTSSKTLKNEVEVSKKVFELYNSGIVISNNINNNVITTTIDMEVLEEKYTEDGILKKALEYFFEKIFDPNIIDNKFEENNFNLAIKSAKDYFEREKENKTRYAYNRAFSFMSEENLKYSVNGCIEDLDNITSENMVKHYNEILNDANANIFIIGSCDEEKVLKIIQENVKDKFKNNKNIFEDGKFSEIDNIKEKEEEENNNQSIIVMIYKILNMTKREKNVILPIFNRIFGVGNNSKLFKNVREKNSLCYDIRSSVSQYDSIMTIESGISYENKDKVINLISKQLKDMQNGKISAEELEDAIKFRRKNLKQFEDYNDSILYIKESSVLFNCDDLDERKNNLETVKFEEIVNLARKVQLNIVYTLKGDNKDAKN